MPPKNHRPSRYKQRVIRCTAPSHAVSGLYVVSGTRGGAEARAIANYLAECAEEAERWHPPRAVPEWGEVHAEHIG